MVIDLKIYHHRNMLNISKLNSDFRGGVDRWLTISALRNVFKKIFYISCVGTLDFALEARLLIIDILQLLFHK